MLRKPCFQSRAFLAIVAMMAVCLPLSGCTSAAEDRGSWGDQRQQSPITIGINNGTATQTPDQSIDAQTANVAAEAIDAKIEALSTALKSASDAGDAAQVKTLTAEIAKLQQAKTIVASGGQVFFVGGNLSLSIAATGSSSAASPGQSTQTPTGPQTPISIPINLTPGAGSNLSVGTPTASQ
ncbi:MAG: hypothetical protein GC162_10335 [Planctomycetes bacterium]|nr:hypothetical protein [Planctomycetota bacterium]